jgi:hypothetical protein
MKSKVSDVDSKVGTDEEKPKDRRFSPIRLLWKFVSLIMIVSLAFIIVGFTMVSVIPAIGVSLVESSGLNKIADASIFVWLCAFIMPYAFCCLMILIAECALLRFLWIRVSAFCARVTDWTEARIAARAIKKLTGGKVDSNK